MYFEFANILVFALLAIGFVILNLVLASLLRPKSTSEPSKLAIYECGEPTIGQAWIRFDIRFYTVALMFVVFDVEIALLFPWAAVFRDLVERGLGWIAFIEAGAFILILMVGLAYVWVRGDIDWVGSPGDKDAEGVAAVQKAMREAARARKEGTAAPEPEPVGASAEGGVTNG